MINISRAEIHSKFPILHGYAAKAKRRRSRRNAGDSDLRSKNFGLEWHRIPESRQAVAINLEWPQLSEDEALAWSRRYFGHAASGPRFVSYRRTAGDRKLRRYDKSSDFWELGHQERNHALWHQMRALSPEDKTSYIARNGLNRVRVDRTNRLSRGRIRWVKYRTGDVLDAECITGLRAGG